MTKQYDDKKVTDKILNLEKQINSLKNKLINLEEKQNKLKKLQIEYKQSICKHQYIKYQDNLYKLKFVYCELCNHSPAYGKDAFTGPPDKIAKHHGN